MFIIIDMYLIKYRLMLCMVESKSLKSIIWSLLSSNFEKFKMYIGGYNTYPFYWPYYLDFGIAGLAIIPFIIGFIISEIYYYLHRNPGLVVLALTTIGFAVIMISFNSDPLTRLDMMFNFIVIVLAQFLFLNKSRKKQQF